MAKTKENLLFDLYVAHNKARRGKGNKDYVKRFENNLFDNLIELRDEIYERRYKPMPHTCFVIDYPKKREIFAPNFRDDIVHNLYYEYTHEMFESTFIYDSYSCIKKRGTHFGIDRLGHHIRSESKTYREKCYIMKFDIRSYFMNINREILLKIVKENISKFRVKYPDRIDYDLIEYLSEVIILTDPTVDCIKIAKKNDYVGMAPSKSLFNSPKGCGLPIGNLTSQLFSNVYLNLYDQFMKREMKCKHYGRYVDDSYVVSTDKDFLLGLVPKVKEFLNETLGLDINEGKTIITTAKYGVEFLGAFLKPFRNYVSNQCIRRMKRKIQIDINTTAEHKRLSNISRIGLFKHYRSKVQMFNLIFGINISNLFVSFRDITDNVESKDVLEIPCLPV